MARTRAVVHTPTYILRRRMILHLLRGYDPGRFLEIGCGQGDLLPYLVALGFEGVGFEISPEVSAMAREIVRPHEPKLRIVTDARELANQTFRYVFAFEVLEHIENDAAALVEWRKWLAPGGRLVITVPAHMKCWTESDEAVGHYRRYERGHLRTLLAKCGYVVELFWSYGFPLTTMTRHLRPWLYRSRSKLICAKSKHDRTLRSSLESTLTVSQSDGWTRCMILLVDGIAYGFHLAQLLFRTRDLGDGYIVVCRAVEPG